MWKCWLIMSTTSSWTPLSPTSEIRTHGLLSAISCRDKNTFGNLQTMAVGISTSLKHDAAPNMPEQTDWQKTQAPKTFTAQISRRWHQDSVYKLQFSVQWLILAIIGINNLNYYQTAWGKKMSSLCLIKSCSFCRLIGNSLKELSNYFVMLIKHCK